MAKAAVIALAWTDLEMGKLCFVPAAQYDCCLSTLYLTASIGMP
jgi:hypothetical protein